MAIDAITGASLPLTSTSAGAGQADAADVQQFNQAMDAPASEEAAVRAKFEQNMRDGILRKLINDTFKRSRHMLSGGD